MNARDLQLAFYEEYRHTAGAELTDDGRDLLNHLARNGRSTKQQIRAALHWGERKPRKAAEMLRRLGIPVMASSGNGEGYWLSTDVDEIATYRYHELSSRIASLQDQEARLADTERRLREKFNL